LREKVYTTSCSSLQCKFYHYIFHVFIIEK
jgi:hypothetical protein